MLKKKKDNPAYVSKRNSNLGKKGYSFNDSKWKGNLLSCRKKTISIIKRNNV